MVLVIPGTRTDTSMESDNHRCNICDKCFSSKRSLVLHSKTHSREHCEKPTELYMCSKCGKVAKTKQALERHAAYHESDRPYSCDVCLQRFKNTDDRGKHYRRLKRDGKFQHACQVCHKHFKSEELLKKHLVMLGCEKEKNKIDKGGSTEHEEVYEMEDDCVVIKDADDVTVEAESVHCTCKTCGQEFDQVDVLKKHYREFHKDTKKHVCLQCGQTLSSKDSLTRHYSIFHQSAHPYECDICKAKFKIKESLCRHVKFVHKDGGYMCEICHKNFSQPVNLKKHMAIHSSEKEFVCTVCGKEFRWKQAIQKHLLMHKNNVDNKNRQDFIRRKVIDEKCTDFVIETDAELVHESNEMVTGKLKEVVEIGRLVLNGDLNDYSDKDNVDDDDTDNGDDEAGENVDEDGDSDNDLIEMEEDKGNDNIEMEKDKNNGIIEFKSDKNNDIIETDGDMVLETGSRMYSAIDNNKMYKKVAGINVNVLSKQHNTALVENVNDVMVATHKRKMQSLKMSADTNKKSRHQDSHNAELSNGQIVTKDMQSMIDMYNVTDARLHPGVGNECNINASEGNIIVGRKVERVIESQASSSSTETPKDKLPKPLTDGEWSGNATDTGDVKGQPENSKDKAGKRHDIMKALRINTAWAMPNKSYLQRRGIFNVASVGRSLYSARPSHGLFTSSLPASPDSSSHPHTHAADHKVHVFRPSSIRRIMGSTSDHVVKSNKVCNISAYTPSEDPLHVEKMKESTPLKDKEETTKVDTTTSAPDVTGKFSLVKHMLSLQTEEHFDKTLFDNPLYNHPAQIKDFKKMVAMHAVLDDSGHAKKFDLSAKQNIPFQWLGLSNARAKESGAKCLAVKGQSDQSEHAVASGSNTKVVATVKDIRSISRANSDENRDTVPLMPYIPRTSIPTVSAPAPSQHELCAKSHEIGSHQNNFNKSHESVSNQINSRGSGNPERAAASEYRPSIMSRFGAMRSMVRHSQSRQNNERNTGSLGGLGRLCQYQSVLRNPFEITSAAVQELKSLNSTQRNSLDEQLYLGQFHFTSPTESVDAYTSSSNSGESSPCSSVPVPAVVFSAHAHSIPTSTTISHQDMQMSTFLQCHDIERSSEPREYIQENVNNSSHFDQSCWNKGTPHSGSGGTGVAGASYECL